MNQQEQDDLKLVAEFDKWEQANKEPGRSYKYRTSWDWQIPVWAKLCSSYVEDIMQDQFNGYEQAVRNNNPADGFKIIVSIIKRIK
jgi:hypothetical protein